MKYYITFILFFIITSSFAQKAEHDVINDFITVELKDLKYDSIHVQIQPLDVLDAVNLYQQAYLERNNQNSPSAVVWTIPELKEWGFSENEIINIKDVLKKDNTNKTWGKKDFVDSDFVFKDSISLKNVDMIVRHLNSGNEEFVLKISRPVFSKNKKYALFQFHLINFRFGYAKTPNREAVIMKKERGRWVFFGNIRQAAYQ